MLTTIDVYKIINIREKAYRDEVFVVSSVKSQRHQIMLVGKKLKQTKGGDLWNLLPNNSVDAKKSNWAKREIEQEQGRDTHQKLLYTQNRM